MLIILSPAKNIDMNKELKTSDFTNPVFLKEAEQLMSKLKKVSSKKLGDMMSISKDLAELNYQRNQLWESSEVKNDKNAHAGAVFNGEVYRGLDAETMNANQLSFAQDHVRILSGLYGILRPLDLMEPYRLEMGTKWAITSTKPNLYKFWGKKIAEEINKIEDKVLVNLASSEYFKAVDRKTLKAKVITPVFKEFKNGEYKMLMVYAKKARGLMTRYAIDNNIQDPEQLKLFDTEGYLFNVNLSSENEWVFTR